MKRKNFKFIKTNIVTFSKFGEIKRSSLFISKLVKKYYLYNVSKKGS
jgi:hypothetical protein